MITIRARAWGLTVVSLVLLATAMGGASGAVGPPDGLVGGPARLAADAGTGILVSEVVTGGQAASDEFVELYNASTVIVDLTGLELVYASASGATISRKVVWTSPTQVSPGHHLLIANGAGTYAATADAVYSGASRRRAARSPSDPSVPRRSTRSAGVMPRGHSWRAARALLRRPLPASSDFPAARSGTARIRMTTRPTRGSSRRRWRRGWPTRRRPGRLRIPARERRASRSPRRECCLLGRRWRSSPV